MNWIVDNQNDSAPHHETPMEDLVYIEIEEIEPRLSSEKVKLSEQELRNRAHMKKPEDEMKFEREREKLQERTRAGKELFEARQMAEELQIKRFEVADYLQALM